MILFCVELQDRFGCNSLWCPKEKFGELCHSR